jgi:hypothetical protein
MNNKHENTDNTFVSTLLALPISIFVGLAIFSLSSYYSKKELKELEKPSAELSQMLFEIQSGFIKAEIQKAKDSNTITEDLASKGMSFIRTLELVKIKPPSSVQTENGRLIFDWNTSLKIECVEGENARYRR